LGKFGPASPSSNCRPDGFGWNQNVEKNDHRINPKPARRAGWRLRPQVGGRLANLKECVLCTDFAGIREDTDPLTHHPHGKLAAETSREQARRNELYFG